MNKVLRIITVVCAAAVLSCGCINVQFTPAVQIVPPPLADDARVIVCYEESQIPAPPKEQQKIGNVVASASSTGFTLTDIQKKLMKEAAAHGANVVLIGNIDQRQVGTVRSDQVKNERSSSWTPDDDSTAHAHREDQTIRDMSSKGSDMPAYKITVTAQFIKVPEQAVAKERVFIQPPKNARQSKAVKKVKQQSEIRVH